MAVNDNKIRNINAYKTQASKKEKKMIVLFKYVI